MNNIEVESTHNVGINYKICNIGDRLLALILDSIIISAFSFIMMYVISLFEISDYWIMMVIFGAPTLLYHYLFEIFYNGQSVGKIWRRIKVMSDDGRNATIGQYTLRFLLRPIDSMYIGVIVIIFNKKSKRLGDVVAGTVVVKKHEDVAIENLNDYEFNANHECLFPEEIVYTYKDADIALVKNILKKRVGTPKHKNIKKLAEKVRAQNRITATVPDYKMLKALTEDYDYYVLKRDEL